MPRKRSGLNVEGSWNTFGSCAKPLLRMSKTQSQEWDEAEVAKDEVRYLRIGIEIESGAMCEMKQSGQTYQILGNINAPLGIR
jgi:hypothetical protein